MTIKRLYYYCEICKDLNLSNTAKRLFVSQQSLSYAIRSIEDHLKCTLFVRTASGLQMTEQGRYLYSRFSHILDELAETHYVVSQGLAVPVPALRISLDTYVYNITMHVLPHCCANVPVDYSYCTIDRCLHDVMHGQADATILPYKPDTLLLSSAPLWREPVCVLLPTDHPLAGQAAVSLHDLKEESLLLSKFHQSSNNTLLESCAQYGVTFHQVILPSPPLQAVRQCAKGQGIVFIARHAIKNASLPNCSVRALPLIEPLSIEMHCAYRSQNTPPPVLQFIEHIQNAQKSYVPAPSVP